MAEVLAHPCKDCDFSHSVTNLKDGQVYVRTHDGQRLSDQAAVFLLEQAKQIIILDSLEE